MAFKQPSVGDLVWIPAEFAVLWRTVTFDSGSAIGIVLKYISDNIVEILVGDTLLQMHVVDCYKTKEEADNSTVGLDDLLEYAGSSPVVKTRRLKASKLQQCQSSNQISQSSSPTTTTVSTSNKLLVP